MSQEIPTPDEVTPVPPAGQAPAHIQPKVPFLRRLPPIPFALLALAVIFFLYQFVGGGITLLLVHGKITAENVQFLRWATALGQVLFILVPTLLMARMRGIHIPKYFRLHVPDYREVILTVVAVFSLQQVLQAYMIAQDAIPLPSSVKQIVDYFKTLMEDTYRLLVVARSTPEFLFVVLVVAFIPAFVEELLFRGLIQRSFEEATNGIRGAVIAGLIFGLYHLNPFSLIPLATLGMYFGFIVYRSQNIWVAISAHFFNNFVACVAAFLQLSNDFVAIAPGRTPSATLVLVNFLVFALVFVGATYYYIRVTGPATDTEH